MRDAVKFTAYVTKYALTAGIQSVFCEHSSKSPKMVSWYEGSYFQAAHGDDWHGTPEQAIARAEEMRGKKIKALEKQIAKLKAMTFTADKIKHIETKLDA